MPRLVADNLTLIEFSELVKVSTNHSENSAAGSKAGVVQEIVSDKDNTTSTWTRVISFISEKSKEHSFILLVFLAILIAYAYPPGASYLKPEITAGYIAVIFIFLMTGIGLKTEELVKSVSNMKFNASVQIFNLGFLTSSIYGISRLLILAGMNEDLANGMVICAALPMSINMVVVFTASAGGNEAAAIFNAAFGNLIGVFISPAWILLLLRVNSEVGFFETILKLVYRVFVPVMVGQIIHVKVPSIKNAFMKNKKVAKAWQERSMAFIVYTVFCRTFKAGTEASVGEVFLMAFIQVTILLIAMRVAWSYMFALFPAPEYRRFCIMGFYGCHHKTIAMGIPLLNAIFDGDPRLGMYTLPLLVWHPGQLIIGSFLAGKISAWVDKVESQEEAVLSSSEITANQQL